MILIPYKFFDSPPVIDTAITPIPASSQNPMQVIADSGINTGVGITYTDNTGDFVGVYIGPAGSETLLCIIGGGLSSVSWGKILPNSRISLRSMKNLAITNGLLSGALVTA